MGNFKERWNIKSNWQVFVIILVFAITGSCSAYLSRPILASMGITKETVPGWEYYSLYIILIFPIYQILLVSFGFIFGQYTFFWAFEKKMLRIFGLGFLVSKKENPK
jgi:hypothetical protein